MEKLKGTIIIVIVVLSLGIRGNFVQDIVTLVRQYTFLKRHGPIYKGICPFRVGEEKSASFVVSRTKNHFHCVECGLHGDYDEFFRRMKGSRRLSKAIT